ncbi:MULTISPECIES: hypothetical protein [unclassified Campylobacter]|uniref:hypothetical protein n=1 Tax=unclassified Campylobacter TaxID=2593542 RepID=UPI0012381DAA|nr:MULTISPECIES: hypothetical protein [unclassified Campylobacter]KAA6226046.1 hypothetical protein FMM55_05400 [Campylobacter sp. LR196d]KAA6226639.1 hypothetical protein FMM57_05580 [Campylobacter sp. LR286c]KAA6227569.1 hypothetical protein FMM54_02605 [Campylobacter sp. LR185c]KAA6230009.1 hypothetical protein FMM58_06715 [Campylobacter sp. LR291e]KAA6230852.1 hypothetical protein FMM56_05820 [Campylobacter sp. LR264d]
MKIKLNKQDSKLLKKLAKNLNLNKKGVLAYLILNAQYKTYENKDYKIVLLEDIKKNIQTIKQLVYQEMKGLKKPIKKDN